MTTVSRTPRVRPAQRAAKARKGPSKPVGRRSSLFLGIFALIVILNLFGLLMVLSASAVTSYYEYGSAWYQFQRQFLWLLLGSVALLTTMRIDYHRWRPWSRHLLIGSLVLLVLVLIPGLGVNVNGSSRWLGFGAWRIQPSELAKLAVVLFVADLLARRADRLDDTRLSIRPVVAVFGLVAALFMLQPNLGTTIILGVIVFVMLFVAGVPLKPLGKVVGVGACLAAIAAVLEPYRMRRLMAFRDPWADPLNTGYQTIQSQVSIASGGLTGVGLGEGRAKWGFLPFPHTDFIFAIISEELGLVGALTVVALFVALGVLGVRTALGAPDRFGLLLATGVTTWILFQAFVNIGAVVGALPITGVPLPFVSFGGSSLLVLMAASGLLLNVARQAR
ncbi:MAG: putative lipid II flippase FtsW [Acidimicrobiales bacterium]|jgi:cell division protein FtsW